MSHIWGEGKQEEIVVGWAVPTNYLDGEQDALPTKK